MVMHELVSKIKKDLIHALNQPESFIGLEIELDDQAKPIWIKNSLRWLISSKFELYVEYRADRRRLQDKHFLELFITLNLFKDFRQSKYGYDGISYSKNFKNDINSIIGLIEQIFIELDKNNLSSELKIFTKYTDPNKTTRYIN